MVVITVFGNHVEIFAHSGLTHAGKRQKGRHRPRIAEFADESPFSDIQILFQLVDEVCPIAVQLSRRIVAERMKGLDIFERVQIRRVFFPRFLQRGKRSVFFLQVVAEHGCITVVRPEKFKFQLIVAIDRGDLRIVDPAHSGIGIHMSQDFFRALLP